MIYPLAWAFEAWLVGACSGAGVADRLPGRARAGRLLRARLAGPRPGRGAGRHRACCTFSPGAGCTPACVERRRALAEELERLAARVPAPCWPESDVTLLGAVAQRIALAGSSSGGPGGRRDRPAGAARPSRPAYHDFADRRACCGMPLRRSTSSPTSASSLPARGRSPGRPLGARRGGKRVAGIVFGVGLLLTGLGSAWYHGRPEQRELVWDRLPLSALFPTVFAVVIGDRVSRRGRPRAAGAAGARRRGQRPVVAGDRRPAAVRSRAVPADAAHPADARPASRGAGPPRRCSSAW